MDESPKPLLLLVDDDPLITDALSFALGHAFEIISSHSRAHALQIVRQLRQPPQFALIDLGLPPLPHRPDEGFALVSELLAIAPDTRILVLSGQSDEANARHARTLGAIDFVAKPCDPGKLLTLLQRTLSIAPSASSAEPLWTLVGESPALDKLRAQIRQYGDSPFPVLIEGESGSGKEIVARGGFHLATRRGHKPFFALNCAAIAPTLVEPTLFGYAKGAFTGAVAAKAGYFEDAEDGTLLLDEIGELPLDLQAKLLRVLENGEFQRVGETLTRHSRARILAATNRDLRQEVRAGRFRADLYHRLSVFTVSVPPLREMGDDRLRLLDHFRNRYARETGHAPFLLDNAATGMWQGYAFPGNVRELRNIVIRLMAKHAGAVVTADTLADEFDFTHEPAGSPAALPTTGLPERWEDVVPLACRRLGGAEPFNLDQALRAVERGYIEGALQLTQGNVSQAAKLLGLSRTTLYSRMEAKERE